jgi:hypothetical protein
MNHLLVPRAKIDFLAQMKPTMMFRDTTLAKSYSDPSTIHFLLYRRRHSRPLFDERELKAYPATLMEYTGAMEANDDDVTLNIQLAIKPTTTTTKKTTAGEAAGKKSQCRVWAR